MKTYGELICRCGEFHAPTPLPQGRTPRYSLDIRLGEPQSLSQQYGEVKILEPTWTRTPTSNP
jgi:hypothetical protein